MTVSARPGGGFSISDIPVDTSPGVAAMRTLGSGTGQALDKSTADALYLSGGPGGAGLSAYQLAVQQGFTGDLNSWLASLIGPIGPPGSGSGSTNAREFHVDDYGAKGDSTGYGLGTDNFTTIKACYTAASAFVAGGAGRSAVMVLGGGRYRMDCGSSLDTLFAPRSGLSVIGIGEGATTLALENPSSATQAPNAFRANGSALSPITGCTYSDFTLDMTGITNPSISPTHGKGFYVQFMKNCRWVNVTVKGAKATGFGCDFLVDCLFLGARAEGCGNNTTVGHSGIGIGTGGSQNEYVEVVGCYAIDNKNFGIFFEKQGSGATSYWSRGALVSACEMRGNKNGFGNLGVEAVLITGCQINENTALGVLVGLPEVGSGTVQNEGYETDIVGCTIMRNPSGVQISSKALRGRNRVSSCRIAYNTNYGVVFSSQADVSTDVSPTTGFDVVDNHIHNNGKIGVVVGGSTAGFVHDLHIERNCIFNNGQSGSAGLTSAINVKISGKRHRYVGNVMWDDQAVPTQSTGLEIPDAGAGNLQLTDAFIADNDGIGCATPFSIAQSRLAGRSSIERNRGDVPPAITTSTISSNSTYTAGPRPTRLYVSGSVSAIKKNGTALGIVSGEISLAPNQAVAVETSGTANLTIEAF